MPSALARKLLFGVAFLFALLTSALAGQYPDEAKSTRTTVTVHVVWLSTHNAVNHWCSFLQGKEVPEPPAIIVGCFFPRTTTIYAVEPKNFNDHYGLEIIGHEFWHALGAEHPEI